MIGIAMAYASAIVDSSDMILKIIGWSYNEILYKTLIMTQLLSTNIFTAASTMPVYS